ncbi:MAG: hypothetical protein IJ306_10890 [Oscillospiraceae bacterium]|nr:hypothetical protein [Oscillospiraceae bacterium]
MPDLSEQLSAILQNPEAQQNIMAMLSSLQGGGTPPQPQNQNSNPPFDFSALFQQAQPPQTPEPAMPGFDINMLMKLQSIFSKMSCDDENINLLRALRPHLREPKKVDDAINILRLMSVLPALSESGIFGGGFR